MAEVRERARSALFGQPITRVEVGRFVVLEKIGQGAMGSVFAAYDPSLDRRVALKILHSDGAQDERRLVREAQAIAKLAHPNVISVFEVGTYEGRTFVAMEFVAGVTLRTWLRTERPIREIVSMFEQAGRGLSAAHRAGLIHRDFKPDNVMVGDDGRARVLDFGLVRPAEFTTEPSATVGTDASKLTDVPLTRRGAVVGTPGYMAPEQFDGQAEARSDQFAFCCALYEAICGSLPFAGETVTQRVAAIDAGAQQEPEAGRRPPPRVWAAIVRGLSADPRARFTDMDELLAALRDSSRTRKIRWAVAAAVVTTACAGIGGVLWGADIGEPCTTGAEQMAEIWNAEREARILDAIDTSAVPYAPQVEQRVKRGLSKYADAWVAKHVEVCEATAIGQEQSPEVLDLRMQCLRERQWALESAIDILQRPDRTVLANATDLVAGLPSIEACDDVDRLRARMPPLAPEDAPLVDELRQGLARARTYRETAHYDEGLIEVDAVLSRARKTDYQPLLAEAYLERGHLRANTAAYDEGVADLQRAFELALELGHDDVAVEAARRLTLFVGGDLAQFERGGWWAKLSLALARRRPNDVVLRAHVLNAVGRVEEGTGQFDEALQRYRSALELIERAPPASPGDIAELYNSIASVQRQRGEYEAALGHYRHSLEIRRREFGPSHPITALALNNVAIVLDDLGRYAEALELYEQASAIQRDVLAADHPEVAITLGNKSVALLQQGQTEQALAHAQQALAIREAALPRHHPDVAGTLELVGNCLMLAGRTEDALVALEGALEIEEVLYGPRHRYLGVTLLNMGVAHRRTGDNARALSLYRRALAISRRDLGDEHTDVAAILHNIGNISLDAGDPEEAQEHYRRALAIREQQFGVAHRLTAGTRVQMARSLLSTGDVQRAIELAQSVTELEGRFEPGDTLARAQFVLARAYREQGEGKRARRLAQDAKARYARLKDTEAVARVDAWLDAQ